MSELIETIEKKAAKAEADDLQEYETRQAERKERARAKRRQATLAFIIRLAVTVLLVLGMRLAAKFGLMADTLVLWLYAAVVFYLALYLGAWVQFMWCKGGLLEWQK